MSPGFGKGKKGGGDIAVRTPRYRHEDSGGSSSGAEASSGPSAVGGMLSSAADFVVSAAKFVVRNSDAIVTASNTLNELSTGSGYDPTNIYFFTSETNAYKFMRKIQDLDKKEVGAWLVERDNGLKGILVEPWNENTNHSAQIHFEPGKGNSPNGDSYFLGVVRIIGEQQVEEVVTVKLIAHIHTHPGPASAYEGPSGYGNVHSEVGGGDEAVFKERFKGKVPMFIIGPTKVSKINPAYPFKLTKWIEEGTYQVKSGNRHQIGTTKDLLTGKLSLFKYVK